MLLAVAFILTTLWCSERDRNNNNNNININNNNQTNKQTKTNKNQFKKRCNDSDLFEEFSPISIKSASWQRPQPYTIDVKHVLSFENSFAKRMYNDHPASLSLPPSAYLKKATRWKSEKNRCDCFACLVITFRCWSIHFMLGLYGGNYFRCSLQCFLWEW